MNDTNPIIRYPNGAYEIIYGSIKKTVYDTGDIVWTDSWFGYPCVIAIEPYDLEGKMLSYPYPGDKRSISKRKLSFIKRVKGWFKW